MLNLHHLKYFRDAAASKSLISSAKTNRISHSAVSQAIRSLESQLGVPLLIHRKRSFELSVHGERLFRRSSALFDNLEDLVAGVQARTEKLGGPLRVGLSHSIGLSSFADRLASFCGKHPEAEPVIRIGNSQSLEKLLASREIELGFGMEDGRFSRYERAELQRGRFVLVKSKSKRLTRSADTFIVGDKGAEVAALGNLLRKSNPHAVFIEVESWEIIARLAQAGLGQGLVPDYVVKSPQYRETLTANSKDGLPGYQLCAFFRSERGMSPLARAFLRSIADTK